IDNFGYLTGYWSPGGKNKDIGWTGKPLLSLAAIPLEREVEPFFLIVGQPPDVEYFDPWIKDRRFYGVKAQGYPEHGEDKGDFFQSFSQIIEEKGLSKAKLGLELGYEGFTIEVASSTMVERLRSLLPDAEIKNASKLLREMRLIKTNEEIERIKGAANISESVIRSSFEEVTDGMTEVELEQIIRKHLVEHGSDTLAGYVNFGEDDILRPVDKKLKKGDFIRIDLGCTYRHYFADVARSVSFGEPSAKLKRIYDALHEVHNETMENIEPGAKCSKIFGTAKKTLKKLGVKYDPPLVAHGIGLCVHEGPYISDNDASIQPGMTFAVEIVEKMGKGSFLTVEDTVVCEKHCCRDLTTLPKDLVIIQ
ncbi:MAG: aminopeptidase P family protein, partial [Candidatus Bathyarchaeota archaeon]